MSPKAGGKPILALDFDGVLHSYISGWQGADVIPDPPVPGAVAFVREASLHFAVVVYSSRARFPEGAEAMRVWLRAQGFLEVPVTCQKPPAFVSLDDRAITFRGSFPNAKRLLEFRPWYTVQTKYGSQTPEAWSWDQEEEEAKEIQRLKDKREGKCTSL